MSKSQKIKIGFIGGSGLDKPDILSNRKEESCETEFGSPSDSLISGQIENVDCVLLNRRGPKHDINPTNVNYRANIWALHQQGCTHIIATNAAGSLKKDIKPGDLVFPDQFIDKTTKRPSTFYDGEPASPEGVCHIPMRNPFCSDTCQILINAAKELKYDVHESGTIIVVEGPRFSSKAESKLFQSWGADIIGMTSIPEVCLANELGMCYATIAIATDYDCWGTTAVCVKEIDEAMRQNARKAAAVILKALPVIAEKDWYSILNERSKIAKDAVM